MLEPYIASWEQEHEEAESAPLWEATRKCIGELEDRLRTGRTVRFEGKACCAGGAAPEGCWHRPRVGKP